MSVEKNVKDFLINSANKIRDDFVVCVLDEISRKEIKSPIERILYIALSTVREKYLIVFDLDSLYISAQQRVGHYIVDFIISFQDQNKKEVRSIIIECDGHEFHDTTERQRSYEKKRDRFLQKNGYSVYHYTGSDIVKNSYRIACEIIGKLIEYSDEEDLFILFMEGYSNGE